MADFIDWITGSDFKVGIQSISQPGIKDVSDNYFTVTTGTTSPASITVTSPNGGEIWKRGNAYPIKSELHRQSRVVREYRSL